MIRSIRPAAILTFALASLLAHSAHAQGSEYAHTVRPGDTLASIAQTYYGDPTRENVLVAANGLAAQGGTSIVEGLRLVIPAVIYHRVDEGETWRELADRYYGDPDRVAILLTANDAEPGGEPDVGAQLLVPYPLRHVVKPGEQLAHIGSRYYADREHTRWLRIFNRKTTKLVKGSIVLVPMFDLVLSEAGRHKLEKASGQKIASGDLKQIQADLERKIPELRKLSSEGHFVETVALANQLVGTGKTTEYQTLRILRELATAYVALRRDDLAVEALHAVVQKQPGFELDSQTTSPRVLAVLKQARELAKSAASNSAH